MIAKWLLLAILSAGALLWWWPGLVNWAALIGGLLAVWVLWMFWQLMQARHGGTGHPLHAMLLVLAAIVLYHLNSSARQPAGMLGGSIDLSLVFELAIFALAVMLCQSLLASAGTLMLSIAGLTMMAGPTWGAMTQHAATLRPTLALLAQAGVCVWLGAGLAKKEDLREKSDQLSRTGRGDDGGWPGQSGTPALSPGWRRWRMLGYVVPALLAEAIMLARAPLAVAGGAALVAAAALLVLAVRKTNWVRYISLAVLTAGAALAAARIATYLGRLGTHAGPLGKGEAALADIPAGSSGLTYLAGMAGWAGLAWVIVATLAVVVYLLHRSTIRRPVEPRMILWTAAALLTLAALLGPVGLFLPAGLAAAALVWGLLPVVLRSPCLPSRGWVMLALVVAVLGFLGLMTRDSLPLWSVCTLAGDDKTLHAVTGVLMTALMTWFMGGRKVRWGLVGIFLAICFGAAGELAQQYCSSRGGEVNDFLAHLAGCLAATIPYLLCMYARRCESPDARKTRRLTG